MQAPTGRGGAVEGQEVLSLRSDGLSSWESPGGGRAVPGTLIFTGVRERSGWLLTVEVAQG